MRKIWAGAMALSAGVVGLTGVAGAQEARDDSVTYEEIVVTAQLREQNIIEVPIAVTAYGGDFMDRLGIERFEELALFVPGLEIQEQSPNNAGFVIRGVTSDSGEATTEPRVAIFQDGVSISRNRGSYIELFDLERVEVARGPQATLFGRGALIGAISLIQNKAELNELSFRGEIGAGDNGYARGLAVLNVPVITDQVGLRVAITARERNGFVDNVLDPDGDPLGSVSVLAGRVSLRVEPSADTRFDLIVNYHEDDNEGTAFKSGSYAACAPTGAATVACGDTSPFSAAALNTFGGFEGGRELGLERQVHSITLLGSHRINENFTLNSVSGYRYFESFETFDPDGFGLNLTVAAEDAKGIQYSQDFRLSYEGEGALSWFVGASYFYEDGRQRVPLAFDERIALMHVAGQITPAPQSAALLTNSAFLRPVLQAGFGVPSVFSAGVASALKPVHTEQFTNWGETEALDIYGDVTYAVTDRFEVSGGLRWTQDDKESRFESVIFGTGSTLGTLLALPTLPSVQQAQVLTAIATTGRSPLPIGLFTQPSQSGTSDQDTFDAFTWRLVGRYALTEDASLWASHARGRRPEVLGGVAPSTPGGAPGYETIPAETVDSFEIGARARLRDLGLDIEGSLFHYTYENFQTSAFNGTQLITINAGEASANGFEGQIDWRPTRMWEVFATYSYNDARLESGAFDGNKFRLSPDHSASLGVKFEHVWSGVGVLTVIPTYTWQSEIFFDDDNDAASLQRRSPASLSDRAVDEVQDAYGLFNLRARFETESERWAIEGFVNNIADEEYIIDAGNTGDTLGIPTFIRGSGVTSGAELTFKF